MRRTATINHTLCMKHEGGALTCCSTEGAETDIERRTRYLASESGYTGKGVRLLATATSTRGTAFEVSSNNRCRDAMDLLLELRGEDHKTY